MKSFYNHTKPKKEKSQSSKSTRKQLLKKCQRESFYFFLKQNENAV